MSLGWLSSGLMEGGRWGATGGETSLSSYCLKEVRQPVVAALGRNSQGEPTVKVTLKYKATLSQPKPDETLSLKE